MVLLECRGVDSTHVPAKQRLSPDTCWTRRDNGAVPGRLHTFAPLSAVADRPSTRRWHSVRPSSVHRPSARPACFGAAPDGVLGAVRRGRTGRSTTAAPSAAPALPPEAARDDTRRCPATRRTASRRPTARDQPTSTSGPPRPMRRWAAPQHGAVRAGRGAGHGHQLRPGAPQACRRATSRRPTRSRRIQAVRGDRQLRAWSAVRPVPAGEAPAVSGELWWTASNWRNRITVPLTFAQTANVCDVVGAGSRDRRLRLGAADPGGPPQWAPTSA